MINLFFSYSHRDEDYRNELEVHLSMLNRQGLVDVWHDRRILAGGDIDNEIRQNLEEADVILLLVSPYFLASDYCYDMEMQRALERHENGAAIVIPVILEPCDWQNSEFKNLRATPTDGKPISKFANMHDAFLEVTKDIRQAAKKLNKEDLSEARPKPNPTPHKRATNNTVRSSNLRVRKEFTDHERDKFVDESFEYIASFFENSLDELVDRNPNIDTRFKRTNETEFTVAVYKGGDKATSCRVWLPTGSGGFGGDIAYRNGDSGISGGFNDSINVEDDGHKLGLKPMGMSHMIRSDLQKGLLTMHGAAEYFWEILIGPLQ